MSQMPTAAPLSIPTVEREHFPRTFIRTAVCELRFPVLFELEGPKPPLAFANAVRKEYPIAERTHGLNLSDPSLQRVTNHAFRSKGGQWTINLKTSTASLETQRYTTFEDFQARIDALIKALGTFIDSDFFTRIGVRYTNFIPYDRATLSEWINKALVGPLVTGELGDAQEYVGQIRGLVQVGDTPAGYFLQHGIQREEGKPPFYVVDLDFYAEEFEVKGAMSLIKMLHMRQYDLFRWAIGPKTLEALREGKFK